MSPISDLYHDVVRDYAAMWEFKLRGATLEVITPHSTISNKFVSVFLTERGSDIIVSDGGYLSVGEYVNNEVIDQSRCYTQTVGNLENYYHVQRVLDRNEKLIFYIKTQARNMVSSLVHDMSSFITGMVNAQQITLATDQEADTRLRFTKQAGDFLHEVFPARRIKMHQPLRVGDNITFSAGIWRESRVSLVQFITGSTPYHFSTNMAKATVNFQAVAGSSLAQVVDNKVSFVDTEASGYRNRGNGSYIHLLGAASEVVPWGERGRIVELVESVER